MKVFSSYAWLISMSLILCFILMISSQAAFASESPSSALFNVESSDSNRRVDAIELDTTITISPADAQVGESYKSEKKDVPVSIEIVPKTDRQTVARISDTRDNNSPTAASGTTGAPKTTVAPGKTCPNGKTYNEKNVSEGKDPCSKANSIRVPVWLMFVSMGAAVWIVNKRFTL